MTTQNVFETIGIAGGGQLGRMLADAAHKLGFRVVVLDPTPNSPAGQVADEQIVGDYREREMIFALAEKCDVLTYEIESVNASALEELVAQGKSIHPTPGTLAIIKDKLLQKHFLVDHGIPTAPFQDCDVSNARRVAEELGYPFVLKSRSGGFDGRGNALVNSEADIVPAFEKLGSAPVYAEGFVRFEKELAVVAARTTTGDIQVFPLVETIHCDHVCHAVLMPAPIAPEAAHKALATGEAVLASFAGAGVFGIELFLVGGEVLVNEIAPRVHNSGHVTMEACRTSQFEQHIRAITGQLLGDPSLSVPFAAMVNILGERDGKADPQGIETAKRIPGAHVHLYGKIETRRGRKMGHVNATGSTLQEARDRAEAARACITI